MKAALVLLFAAALLAADPVPETGPNFNEPSRRELPYPLPPDFNECVMVVWSAEFREQRGKTGGFYRPPITPSKRAEIDKGRRNGWGTYRLCNDRGA